MTRLAPRHTCDTFEGMENLPKWADARASLAREVAPYVDMTPEQRAVHLRAACQLGMRLLAAHDSPEDVFLFRERLPASSIEALKRLRAEARR